MEANLPRVAHLPARLAGVPILPDIMPLGPGPSDIAPGLVAPPRMAARIATVARQFDRGAGRLAAHDFLLREVGHRLISRLEYIRLAPARLLDVGCGMGRTRSELLARYPDADWIGVELSAAMMRSGRNEQQRALGLARWWRQAPRWVLADAARLPFADQTADLVFSNLMLHWHPTPHVVFPEWKRVLSVGGLLMFSCFGPDTLKELRAAVAETLPRARPMPYVDMHDFGDMLVASGFATPVMDVESITLTYRSPRELCDEVRALGASPLDDRWPALPSGRQARLLMEALAARRDRAGRIPLTFEVAYGHAWKPAPREAGVSTVTLESLRQRLPRGKQ
jgi:malonyl-CoA O-methyltransferase